MSAQDFKNTGGMDNGNGKDWSEDPRLTAYALGELEGDDLKEMEALCARKAGARAYVEEMRALGGELEAQFGAEGGLALSGEQRAAIEREMDASGPASKGGRLLHMNKFVLATAGVAAAAMLSAIVFKSGQFAPSEQVASGRDEVSSKKDPGSLGLSLSGGQRLVFEEDWEGAPSSDSASPKPESATGVASTGYAGKQDSASQAAGTGSKKEELSSLRDLGYMSGGSPGGARQAEGKGTTAQAKQELYRGPGDTKPGSNKQADDRFFLGLGVRASSGPSSSGPSGPSSPRGTATAPPTKAYSKQGLAKDGAPRRLSSLGYLADDGPVDRDGRQGDISGETYKHVHENPFKLVGAEPLSTFSVDVDTASYANARDLLNRGTIPPADAVRVEEFINYFRYDYGAPEGSDPFAVNVEVGTAPWAPQHRLMRVGLQAKETLPEERKASNLVFLLDVSGSMNSADKLPLLQSALHMLVQELDERDSVAIVVYAGASGLLLPATHCNQSAAIHAAIDSLRSGGSTNGGAGIQLAYQVAAQHFIPGGINRVILGTDGDFNVGVSDEGGLERLITEKAKTGVFLSVLGFGRGNLQDVTMETLADKGNGNYAYIDSVLEARKVLVKELGSTLEVVAKDVKIQVEFNPSLVQAYRLIGYENRMLAAQDFNDDKKDAGEIGAGHRVTALYEVVPVGVSMEKPAVDELRYQMPQVPTGAAQSGEICTVKLRYKRPAESTSILLERPVQDSLTDFQELSASTRWATAVASFALLLKSSSTIGQVGPVEIIRWATESVVEDSDGYCRQFIYLVGRYEELNRR